MGELRLLKPFIKEVDNFRLRRIEQGITQKELGEYCGVNRVSIIRHEKHECYLRADKLILYKHKVSASNV